MKRILILAILLMSSLAWAGSTTVVVGQGGGEASCTGVEGNNATTTSWYTTTTANYLILKKITLTCGGTPSSINARTRTYSSTDAELTFCVYSDSGGSPNARLWYGSAMYNENQASTAQTITDSTINYKFAAGDYWIGIFVETTGRWYSSGTTGGTWFKQNVGSGFPTPPATAGAATTTGTDDLEGWLVFP